MEQKSKVELLGTYDNLGEILNRLLGMRLAETMRQFRKSEGDSVL